MYKKINKKKLFRENDPFRYYKHIIWKMEQKEEKTLTNYSEILKKINNWEKWKDWFKESSLSNKPTPIWPPQQLGKKPQ